MVKTKSRRAIPSGIYYGELKLDPRWDPCNDPRFDKLLAELAPHD